MLASRSPSTSRRTAGRGTAVRRLRMELFLPDAMFPAVNLDPSFRWRAWDDACRDAHAAVLCESFLTSSDSRLLPSLATPWGCRGVIDFAAAHPGFVAAGSWLLERCFGHGDRTALPCTTIQTVAASPRVVAIQNLAVLPELRGQGLGRATLVRSLRTLRGLEFDRAQLDVTESNQIAVALYQSLGFQVRRAFYCTAAAEAGMSDANSQGFLAQS